MNPEIVRPNIVGRGEVRWDVFPDAAHFGGAPANFAGKPRPDRSP